MRLDSQQLRGVIAVPLPHHRPRYYWFPSPRGYRSFPHNPPPRLRAKIDTGIRTGRVDKKLFVEEYFSKVLSRVREIFGDLFEEAGDSRSGKATTRIERNFVGRLLAHPMFEKLGQTRSIFGNFALSTLLGDDETRRISNSVSIRADRILNVISKVICFGKRDSARDNVRWMERWRQSRSWLVALAYR